MAEYSVAAQIADWPAFAPWVHRVLNRWKTIISKVNAQKFKGAKFGQVWIALACQGSL